MNKPISIVVDNSSSMRYNLDEIDFNIDDVFITLNTWLDKNNYKANYYIFGKQYKLVSNVNEIDFDDNYTNFGNMINKINSDVILISDGVNNYGSNQFNLNKKNKINILGIGNENKDKTDLAIKLLKTTILDNESIRLIIELDNHLHLNLINQHIYISNSNLYKHNIGEFDLHKSKYKVKKEVLIPKDFLSEYNIISIDNYDNEQSYENNSFIYSVDIQNLNKKKILMISGSISENTKYIKNTLLNNLYDYDLNHYYRINDKTWNNIFHNIDYSQYDLIVLDNFPFKSKDRMIVNEILERFNKKIFYFMGPHDQYINNEILKKCNCIYEKSSSQIINIKSDLLKYKDKEYVVLPNHTTYNIKCDDNLYSYDNSNSLISENNEIILFFINNLKEVDTNRLDGEKSFGKFINTYVEDIVYNSSRYVNIFCNQINYSTNDSISVYLQLNDNIKSKSVYLNIFDNKNNLYSKIFDYNIIDNNIYLFRSLINKSGNYYIQGHITDFEDNILESNIINIFCNNYSSEISAIYLDSSFLNKIADETSGVFYKYNHYDQFLDNIKLSKTNNVNYMRSNLLSYPYLLLILIILLSVEWYYRTKIGLI